MPRAFVVIGKCSALVPDRYDLLIEFDKTLRRDAATCRRAGCLAKNRVERILREDVFDIGDEKFLVLLLVMKTEREDRIDLGEEGVIRSFEQLYHALIDRFPEAIGLGHGGPRDQSAQIAPVHVARGVVVGIKKIGVLRNL